MAHEKTAVWFIREPIDGALVAVWPDAPIPTFRVAADGPEAVTVELPVLSGIAGQEGIRGAEHGNYADLYVSSEETRENPADSDLYGYGVYGDGGVYGQSTGLAKWLYRGVIESFETTPATGRFTVTLSPISRLAEMRFVDDGAHYTGCPVQIARQLVETFGAGLTWASDNPAACDDNDEPPTFETHGESLRDTLAALRDLLGDGWTLSVTPLGVVRLFAADPTFPSHRLTEGITASDVHLALDGIHQRNEVRVKWSGGTAIRRAAGWTAATARVEKIVSDNLHDEAAAARLAESRLSELTKMQFRGTARAIPPYDIEAIAVGDVVQLGTSEAASVEASDVYGAGAYGDGGTYGAGGAYGAIQLVVAALDYQFYTVGLEFALPKRNEARQLAILSRRLTATRERLRGIGDTEGLAARVTATEGDIAALTGAVNGHESRIDTAEGTISDHGVTINDHGVTISGHTATLSGHDTTLTSHTGSIGDHESRLDTVEADLNTAVTGVKARLTTAEDDINTLEGVDTALDTRLDTVEADLNTPTTGVKARLTTAENGITTLEGADSALDGRLDTVEADLNTAVTGVKARLTTAEGDINALESADTALDTRLDAAEADITTLEGADVALDTRLDTVESDLNTAVTGVKARLTTAESDINALESADVSLDSRLDTLEALNISSRLTALENASHTH